MLAAARRARRAWAAPARRTAAALPALTALPGATAAVLASTRRSRVQALLNLLASSAGDGGFAQDGDDLAEWLALGFTLLLFAALHLVFTPLRGDELRRRRASTCACSRSRSCSSARGARSASPSSGARSRRSARASRARSTTGSRSTCSRSRPTPRCSRRARRSTRSCPQLKEAAALAQQEARFAILALSSASGTAPFDSALRRYVEFLTADGALEVDLEIDPAIRLAPDEQIEIFRIVQEGLGNVRRHAQRDARRGRDRQRASASGSSRSRDDGEGFDGEATAPAGAAEHARPRAASIDGGFSAPQHARAAAPRSRSFSARERAPLPTGARKPQSAAASPGLSSHCSAAALAAPPRSCLRVDRGAVRPHQHVTIFSDSSGAALNWDSTAKRIVEEGNRVTLRAPPVRAADPAGCLTASAAERARDGAQARPPRSGRTS